MANLCCHTNFACCFVVSKKKCKFVSASRYATDTSVACKGYGLSGKHRFMADGMKALTVCRASAGTGKTYTLAARYIALLMGNESDFLFRNILAVTFTNKATAEMKQRILSYLYLMAEGDGNNDRRKDFVGKVLEYIRESGGRAPDVTQSDGLRRKARQVFHNIIGDYDNMKVMTIDSFLQTLVTGMAQAVGIGMSFNVVLDINHTISTAIDEIMTAHINDNPDTEKLLTEYVKAQLADEKGWDVRSKILSMAKEILKEAVQDKNEKQIFDVKTLRSYQRKLTAVFRKEMASMHSVYDKVCNCERDGEIAEGKRYYSMIERVRKSLDNKASAADIFRGLSETDSGRLQSEKFLDKFSPQNRSRALEVRAALTEMCRLCRELRKEYFLYRITNEHLNDLMMMTSVKDRMDVNLRESNSILLARTACLLSKSLAPGDADFIMEKAGIRFKHIMIDEFQDTSVLQWQVFRHLVNEVLGSGGTTFIVGDVKQSIYRWRNGDYTIMEKLGSSEQFSAYYDEKPLTRNYRSQANVVKFNLSLFAKLTSLDEKLREFDSLYREGCNGYSPEHLDDFHNCGAVHDGYVQYRAYPYFSGRAGTDFSEAQKTRKRKVVAQQVAVQMFEDIGLLLDKGAVSSDVLILIRNSSEIDPIVEAYANSALSGKGIKLSSNDSFLLGKSVSVLLVVAALKVICNSDAISREFLYAHGKDVARLLKCDRRMPLYEMVEYVVNVLFCNAENMVCVDDADFINCFLDKLRSYVDRYGSDVQSFIAYWDDELCMTPVPAANSEGIRVMTIHSAKGLEARHLFVPFCSWKLSTEAGNHGTKLWVTPQGNVGEGEDGSIPGKIPVTFKSVLEETAYAEDYHAEKKAQLVDNLNLLYVALTRAADNLFVYSPVNYKSMAKDAFDTVGDLVFECLSDKEVEPGVTLRGKVESEWNACKEDVPAYAQYCVGNAPYIRPQTEPDGKDGLSPFEYRYSDKDKLGLHCYSTRGNISFRQSQESMLYSPGDARDRRNSRIDAGILRHNILAQIKTVSEAGNVVDRFYAKGIIETKEDVLEIKKELDVAWKKWAEMADWFSGNWKVLREVTLICPSDNGEDAKAEMRPDRVMIKNGKAVVLDFKFGKHNHDYSCQVERYVQALRRMGYADVEGWLWYGFDNELVKVC